jgi:hypothetical protein
MTTTGVTSATAIAYAVPVSYAGGVSGTSAPVAITVKN